MKDFWISCGHHLLDRNANGGLVVTDEYLKAYFARPELMPPADACGIELKLHRELLADPRRPVGDEEVLGGLSPTPVLSLMSMLDAPSEAQIDILSDENADSYWQRSDQFDMGLDLGDGGRVATALGEAMRCWVSHLLGIEVAIEPLSQLRDAKLTWYVGLDAEGTRIGDRLWHGETLDERTAGRLLALFHLDFSDPAVVADAVGQEPVYLIMALSSDQSLRMKPQ